jgi:carbon storage regulator
MLVLSRRTNETLVIDNNIRFTVLSVHGNQVRIGIEAPEDIIILREEIIHNASRGPLADTAADSTSDDNVGNREARPRNAPQYRRECSPENGQQMQGHNHEHGRRRGVLGLRRRRP